MLFATLEEFIVRLGPPLIVGLLVLWLNRKMTVQDKKRETMQREEDRYREEVRGTLYVIHRQNSFFIKKLLEVITIHNEKHPMSRIEMGNYPDNIYGERRLVKDAEVE
jgi:hypothetical protein